MKSTELIIEKEYGDRVMPRKSKPLCSCFVGEKMVDMYARFNFDTKCVGWSKAYIGHLHDEGFFDNIIVYDESNEEINKTIDAINEYFKYHQRYLH